MVRLSQVTGASAIESAPLALGLFLSVSALVALCAKHSNRLSKRFGNETSSSTLSSKIAPRSPLPSPKQFLTAISNKTIPFLYKRRTEDSSDEGGNESKEVEEGFGNGGLWQRSILMGEKCQPPDFSGVIYYDCDGKQLPELPPRSPRASPMPRLSSPAAAKHGK